MLSGCTSSVEPEIVLQHRSKQSEPPLLSHSLSVNTDYSSLSMPPLLSQSYNTDYSSLSMPPLLSHSLSYNTGYSSLSMSPYCLTVCLTTQVMPV